MSQFPFDEFSKDLLETLLQPIDKAEAAKTISSEVREIDLYFIPHQHHTAHPELGLLQHLVNRPTSLEAFRNAATVQEIKSCMSKLWDIQHDLAKAAKKKKQTVSTDKQPQLWVITPTLAVKQLQKLEAKAKRSLS